MTSSPSSLRHRFFLALSSVLCVALLALVLIARFQIMPVLLADENHYANAELDRVERAIGAELQHMQRLVEDWAWWDATYQFVQDQRPEYVASNLYDSTLETLDLSLMVFISAENQAYWISGFDKEGEFTSCAGTLAPCDWASDTIDLLLDRIASGLEEETHSWLLATPELSMLGLSPIYSPQKEAHMSGWLAMVRPISPVWIEQLRDTTGIDMTLESLAVEGAAPTQSLQRISPTRMSANRRVAAVPTTHGVRINASLPRQRYQSSLETFRFVLYWTGGLLAVTLLIALLLLEYMVLRPLREFSRFTQHLHRHSISASTPEALLIRRDEIGTLAREFQHLLEYQHQQQANLLDLSQHDPLTGLANRRLFDERLRQSPEDGLAGNGSVSVLMIDIDHFKLYNDHYGHPAGDGCLVALSDCMEQCLGKQGFLVARTGGEEFSVVMPGVSIMEAVDHAERLRDAIVELALPHARSPTASIVTVSIGAAAWDYSHPWAPAALMRAVDQALYRAKENGRDQVEIHRPAIAV